MIRFYAARELAGCLNLRLSKWKRWSRQFLPPDPLGGRQSGYARQYSFSDAFKVYFGGHLVSALGFSVADAANVLSDLNDWFKEQGFFAFSAPNAPNGAAENPLLEDRRLEVFVRPQAPRLLYRIEHAPPAGGGSGRSGSALRQTGDRSWLRSKGLAADRPGTGEVLVCSRCVYVDALFRRFNTLLGSPRDARSTR